MTRAELHRISPLVERLIRRAAGEIILPSFQQLSPDQIFYKSAVDIFTEVDEKVEAFLSTELVKLISGSVIVGEENVHRHPESLMNVIKEEWVWVIDPLDGTNNFVKHSEEFGTIVALVHKGVPVAGWIYLPIHDIFLSGNREDGVFSNGQKLSHGVTNRKTLQQMRAIYRRKDREITEKIEEFPIRFDRHCSAYEYSLVISGECDFIVYPENTTPWDTLAGGLLIEALGGKVAKANGKSNEGDNLLVRSRYLAVRDAADWSILAEHLLN